MDTFYPYGYRGCIQSIHISVSQCNQKKDLKAWTPEKRSVLRQLVNTAGFGMPLALYRGQNKTHMKKEDSRMKKLAVILGSIMLIAAISYPVFAQGPRWGWGHHMKGFWGGGPGYCWGDERGASGLSAEQRTQLDDLNKKFFDETATLRSELRTKSGEFRTFLNSENPDAEKAKALQREISGLRVKLGEKRLDYELEARKIAPEGTYARGYGKGYGRQMRGYGPGAGRGYGYGPHKRGYGPGSCWN